MKGVHLDLRCFFYICRWVFFKATGVIFLSAGVF